MTPDEFVRRLYEAMPSSDELAEYGMDNLEIEEIQRPFLVEKRARAIALKGPPVSALKSLVSEFDCSELEIGLLLFLPKVKLSGLGWHFADCEAEQVVIARDGKIVLADKGKQRLECAEDGTAFLAGIAEFIEIQKHKDKWNGKVTAAAKKCAVAAGGKQYIEFFQMLCSFLG